MFTNRFVQNLLNKILSEDSSEVISELKLLIEHLENKNDPDPEEIILVNTLYQFLEKNNILKAQLKQYIRESNKSSIGSKLDDFYQKIEIKKTFEF